jgi:hypothetical protein
MGLGFVFFLSGNNYLAGVTEWWLGFFMVQCSASALAVNVTSDSCGWNEGRARHSIVYCHPRKKYDALLKNDAKAHRGV